MSTVLALNSGSSSLKFALIEVDAGGGLRTLLAGAAEALGSPRATWRLQAPARTAHPAPAHPAPVGPAEACALLAATLAGRGLPRPQAIGHRIVHGGAALRRPALLDAAVLARIRAAARYAPLHAPSAIELIHRAAVHWPGLPQVACFDTGFHATLPALARVLPLPRALQHEGLQRYGFHGLSCESIVRQLGNALPERLVIAHLGSGASVTAVRAGRSVDTSMGLTPGGGVPMGTRSGDLDPGVLIWLMREQHLSVDALEDLLERRSGLLGLSGLDGDLRHLRAAATTDARAQLAVDLFCSAVCKQVAGMITVLGGLDRLVFTGGIGEHDAATRAAVCQGLAWFGMPPGDDAAAPPPHPAAGRCTVQTLPSQENEQIARHTAAAMSGA